MKPRNGMEGYIYRLAEMRREKGQKWRLALERIEMRENWRERVREEL